MKILHHNAVTNEWYMKQLYPLSVAVYNIGGSALCQSLSLLSVDVILILMILLK